MDIVINRKRSAEKAGDLIATSGKKLFALVEDRGEKYPYHLICLESFTILQSYDSLPTNQEIEEDIGEKIAGVYRHHDSKITLN